MNKLIKIVLLYFITATFCLQAGAEEPNKLSLSGAIVEAMKSNPEISVAKRAYEAANARIWQAASLKDPMFEMEYNKMVANRMLTGQPMKSFAISQEIPFPTKLYLRAKIAAKLAKMAYENYKLKERQILAEIKSTYADLAMIYKSIDVMLEQKNLLEQFSASATTRYAVDEATQGDALRAQVELAKADTELIMLEQKRLTAQARLNVLMNKDPKDEIGMPSPEEAVSKLPALERFYTAAERNNQELKAYRYGIEKGRAAYDLSVNEMMPDFVVRYQQMVQGDKAVGNMWAGMLGVTVPLWFLEKQSFGIKEMKAELEMLKAEYRTKENMVLFDIRDSYARADANKKIVELYETSFIPQADETLRASLKGYSAGKTDFLTLLDSQRSLEDFKLEHYKAILDLRVALADLERSMGVTIDEMEEKDTNDKKEKN